LQVERTEFGADDQHYRIRAGGHELPRHLQGGQRRIASHESQVIPFHTRPETQSLCEHEIRAGREEARAGNRNDVRNRLGRDSVQRFPGRFLEQPGRLAFIDGIPLTRGR
jgi:hypothetical protein